MANKLTVLIPCRDECDNIRDCVDSVRPIADEILVADSGSKDGTLEILDAIEDCRVIQHEWIGYGPFKNWAIGHAKNPWVLVVDADERLSPELADEIQEVLRDPPDGVDAFWISFQTHFMGHPLRFSNWNRPTLRLLHRDSCRYNRKRVHESMNVPPTRTARLRGKLLHFSFWSYDEFFEKYVRYSRLSAEDLRERGKRATVYSLLIRPFLRFLLLYVLRGGMFDGLPGIQICMLMAFSYSFCKQGRLWEMQCVTRPTQHKFKQCDAGGKPEIQVTAYRVGAHHSPVNEPELASEPAVTPSK